MYAGGPATHVRGSVAITTHLLLCDRLAKKTEPVTLVNSSQQLNQVLTSGRVRLLNILNLQAHARKGAAQTHT
jgi:hypothetical protein